ncbi:MAG: YceH family protein [Pirellulaceae bacterium]|nr:YceH family protein [Pirellulaceae bacterium]
MTEFDLETNREEDKKWRSLSAKGRRVAGVLVEKAKTTPAQYPLTINGIVTGANQKSNRSPNMSFDGDQVEEILEELREMGACFEVHGDGRALKYRHGLYEWLGVEKVEMAVMAELLLRGEQTLGDLRARASRMEKIATQADLKEILKTLLQKGLVQELTPPGRGQMVSHNLYLPEEQKRLDEKFSVVGSSERSPQGDIAKVLSSDGNDWQDGGDLISEERFTLSGKEANEDKKAIQEMKGRISELENEVLTLRELVNDLQDKIETIMS